MSASCRQTPGDDFGLERILEKLKARGMRITATRRKILDVLLSAKGPLSLTEIHHRSKGGKTAPDYATVFRTVTALEALQIVHRVNLEKSCAYYELQDPSRHYDHLVCMECGKVKVLDMPCPLHPLEEKIEEEFGFMVSRHSLEFFGTCAECQAAS